MFPKLKRRKKPAPVGLAPELIDLALVGWLAPSLRGLRDGTLPPGVQDEVMRYWRTPAELGALWAQHEGAILESADARKVRRPPGGLYFAEQIFVNQRRAAVPAPKG